MSRKMDAWQCISLCKRLYGQNRIGLNKEHKICCTLCGRSIEAKGKNICDCLNWKKLFCKNELTAIFAFNRGLASETFSNSIAKGEDI